MLLVLSASSEVPVYEQIVNTIKQQLYDGELNYGEELPSVRMLANLLSVNLHTVRHAYRILADEGIISMRLGRRTRICPRPDARVMSKEIKAFLLSKWHSLEQEASLRGLSSQELLDFIASHAKNEVKHA